MRFGLLLVVGFCLGCGASRVGSDTMTNPGSSLAPPPSDRLDAQVVPTGYHVELKVDPTAEDYSGQVSIDLKVLSPRNVIWLHSLAHDISAVDFKVDGQSLAGVSTRRGAPDWLGIQLPRKVTTEQGTLTLSFTGRMNHKLVGMYRVHHDGEWYIYTQFEALDARKAFPCFDEPRFKTPYTMVYTVPSGNRVFSNAPVVHKMNDLSGWTQFTFAKTPPLPTYLVATAIGPLDVAEKASAHLRREDGSVLPIRILTAKGQASRAQYALEEAGRVVALQEAYFGMKYPYAKLDLVAVPDFGAGAMENAGLITYRDRFLLFDRETVTESELRSYIGIHAHEVAHMWFGDLVTMAWWDDLWLNEAFATWFAGKISHRYRPSWETAYRLINGRKWVMDQDSSPASRRMREPIKSRGDIENAFDGITYTKGAAVLDMFERYLGEDKFRDGVRAYMKRHAWGNATFDDLLDALEETSQQTGLKAAMATFIDQPGVPHLRIVKKPCQDGQTVIKVNQSRWQPLGEQALTPGQWTVPFCVRALDADQQTCGLVKREGTTTLTLPVCTEAVLPNSGAGGYLIWSMAAEQMDHLLGRISELSEYEQVNLMANLSKLYTSGDLDPLRLAKFVPKMLTVKSDRIRRAALSLIGQLGELIADEDRERWDTYRANMVKALYAELGWGRADGQGETKQRWDLRRSVINLAGHAGHWPEVIKKARQIADDFLANRPIPWPLVRVALGIDGKHGDRARFKRYRAAFLNETEPRRRGALLYALTSFEFDGFPHASFTLAQDPKLKMNERGRFIWAPVRKYRFREASWTWLRSNLDLARSTMARGGARYFPYYPVSACQSSKKVEIETVFGPLRTGENKVEGIDRHITNAKSRIEQCVVKRARYGPAIQSLLDSSASSAN
ncbi:MAG: M1 family metallopeptidase [Myxococcota bacterium]|nr:M1 family metallopeptidase [Myxococcota bacterium]